MANMVTMELYLKLFLVEQQILKSKGKCSSKEELSVLQKMYDDLRYQIHKARHPEG